MNERVTKWRKPPPSDAIQLGVDVNGARPRGVRFNFLLLVFMRVVACLWLARGLAHWRDIMTSDVEPFTLLTTLGAARLIFFSVANLVAAVGLWLATSWGGVLWLFAAAAGLVTTLISPEQGMAPRIGFAVDVILIVVYFVLSWYAARERED